MKIGPSELIVFSGLILFGILLGWIWPVEGPIDYVYDDYVGNKTIKKPVIGAPTPDTKKEFIYGVDGPDVQDIKEVLIDLSEDGEQEWYLFMPLLKGDK